MNGRAAQLPPPPGTSSVSRPFHLRRMLQLEAQPPLKLFSAQAPCLCPHPSALDGPGGRHPRKPVDGCNWDATWVHQLARHVDVEHALQVTLGLLFGYGGQLRPGNMKRGQHIERIEPSRLPGWQLLAFTVEASWRRSFKQREETSWRL